MILEIGEADLPAHVRDLVKLWRAKAADRPWPARRDILFEELIPWIGRLHLVEVLDDDFRFAVFGTATTGVLKREYTGMRISEIKDPLARLWRPGYVEAVARRIPLFFHHTLDFYGETREHVGWWRAVLPLGETEKVDHLLVSIQMYRPDGAFI
jgi:hypothetical protein